VSNHISACDPCTVLLAQAEDESALVFSTLEREFSTLVPTQRLWTKINDALETERREEPFWQKALAFVRLSLLSPSVAMAAGLILVVGVTAILWMNRTAPITNEPGHEVAGSLTPPAPKTIAPTAVTPPSDTAASSKQPVEPTSVKFERASYRPEPKQPTVQRAVVGQAAASSQPSTAAADAMPGEESYVKTIASLSKSVDDKKDAILRPSERMAYEHDMAVVNDSITKMRAEVKRNPKNQSARQVLYSSYQNKIDLLNSVSQKEELMASIR